MNLPDSITVVNHNGKEIYLLGTAHVSAQSVEDVKAVVPEIQPDTICVELCDSRLKSIRERDSWKKMDVFKILKEKKVPLLIAQLLMTSFYRKLGKELEVTPGAEMIQGVTEAEERNINLVLADRNIETTLRRIWGLLGFWQRMNFLSSVIVSLFSKAEDIDSEMVESLKNKDHLETAMEEFADSFPGIRRPLIEERDIYLAEKIKAASGKKILAVVGAAHVPGIVRRLEESHNLDEITVIPKELPFIQVLSWIIPLLIVVLIGYGFTKSEAIGTASVLIWIFTTGTCAALGAVVALAHPFTILSSFIVAPVTTLHPALGAGFFAGIAQAWVKKPTVHDLESVPEAMETFATFRKNPFTRVLLVFLTVSLGASLGTFVAGFSIFKKVTTQDQTISIEDVREIKDLRSK